MPSDSDYLPWRQAWESALYGEQGFFRREAPIDHFRTSVTASGLLAGALWRLLESEGLDHVVDIGAGRGELLIELDRVSGGRLSLLGVERAPRPAGLPETIGWQDSLPEQISGLLIAHEWLDNVPCEVVEVDESGTKRLLDVDPATGAERFGPVVASTWLDRWWPLEGPGERAEIGRSRDEAWADAVERVDGIAMAVDYGHLARDRPPFGSLRSYRTGREVDVVPDGSRDVTAHVAIDALAAVSKPFGLVTVQRQKEALRALGLESARPPLQLATTDPVAYVRALSSASLSAELLAGGGWGDFWWITVDTRSRCRSVKD